jgi:hypothetical protein
MNAATSNVDDSKLSLASGAFAMAAALTVLFNTALSWAKDAYRPLLVWMNGIAGHNWTTQGLADLILFLGLGLIFAKSHWTESIAANKLILFLTVAVAIAGVGLFAWYALF